MPITVSSSCGRSFTLKDDLAGQLVQCPDCNEEIRVPGGTGTELRRSFEGIDPAFHLGKFLLRQKHMAISEKYYVWDEAGQIVMFVQRPAMLIRNVLAVFGGVVATVVVGGGLGYAASWVEGDAGAVLMAAGALAGLVPGVVVGIALSAKRHVYFYRDDTREELLLKVEQDQKFAPFVATYTIKEPGGETLAHLRKNYIYNIIRKRWHCVAPDGRILSVIKEDSFILSLIRRLFGTMLGALRTNFVFLKGETDEVIGEFNRKFTLLDRYVLDLTHDTAGYLDPRVALAAGVMLDTGEKR
ncbi:MAG: hypothetical protein O7H41_12005 [Planctomycetota bacterium]|nr:hypothetical protein [Planctomycetota bacterium]